ncbi:MAG: aminoacyl-tRNA hydrolase [Candidatus Staskawiczbacteria bacterium]|nr:aminoacyl-tRNA hydrolase [Candidatus Staskawiczbacteria bacterium]
MIIIIGLGNPGAQYKNTRHNVGFMAIDEFAKKNNFPDFELQKKSNAEVSEGTAEGEKIILVKPQTFMNESGKSARAIAKNYKLKAKNFIVVHDDADLPVGKIKIVKERGSAGHKGVESVIKAISNKDLSRIRIGISSQKKNDAMKIVLKSFSPAEQKSIKKTIQKTANALNLYIAEGLEKTMNEFNK